MLTTRSRRTLLAVLTLAAAAAVWREVRWHPGPRARDALALYAPGLRFGERVAPLTARWPGLTLAAYEGLRDSAFAASDGFGDLYVLVGGMSVYNERPPAASARVRGVKLRTASAGGAAAAAARLERLLGAPRVQCWGYDRGPVWSWRDPGGGGVALSLLPGAAGPDVDGAPRRAMLMVVAHGLADELRFARPCEPAASAPPV
jgi:hypothetical protein